MAGGEADIRVCGSEERADSLRRKRGLGNSDLSNRFFPRPLRGHRFAILLGCSPAHPTGDRDGPGHHRAATTSALVRAIDLTQTGERRAIGRGAVRLAATPGARVSRPAAVGGRPRALRHPRSDRSAPTRTLNRSPVTRTWRKSSARPTITTGPFADSWHSDWSFLASPPAATLLFGNVIPPVGGDTLFANQYAAWDALPAALKSAVQGPARCALGAARLFAAGALWRTRRWAFDG